ncbi:MAG: glutamate 5-kinase, partial [Planctomycetaceae bacterium]
MASKIPAARSATESGCHCNIASGKVDRVLERVMAAESVGTILPGRTAAMPAWKRWLGWSADSRGVLTVDAGAR